MFGRIENSNEVAVILFSQKNKFITDAKSFRKLKFFKIDNDFLLHKISRPKMSWKKTYYRERDKRYSEVPWKTV